MSHGHAGPAAICCGLEDLKGTYEGATGEYFAPWRPDDHEVTPGNVVWGMVKGGAIVRSDPAAQAP
jgi:hypothetical protein